MPAEPSKSKMSYTNVSVFFICMNVTFGRKRNPIIIKEYIFLGFLFICIVTILIHIHFGKQFQHIIPYSCDGKVTYTHIHTPCPTCPDGKIRHKMRCGYSRAENKKQRAQSTSEKCLSISEHKTLDKNFFQWLDKCVYVYESNRELCSLNAFTFAKKIIKKKKKKTFVLVVDVVRTFSFLNFFFGIIFCFILQRMIVSVPVHANMRQQN